ncbi:hypothetical protein M422DRAFT_52059 [Sphaerobolus stellatus SS14]|uniref:DUF6533 domain-containing protein n=1 Tax=Sphaerobolus stellatus (strain SS14) TaxID=990650 RepID=A0A0C9TV94_SPHS4|nr:hypothetical protein M422DRAFT_52059 [Sphaerobolus stellatus SS14]
MTAAEISVLSLHLMALINSHVLYERYAMGTLTTLPLYHYILTFQQEILWIWAQKKNISTFLFILFRYFAIIVFIIDQTSQLVHKAVIFWWFHTVMGLFVNVATGARWVLCLTIPVYLGQLGMIIIIDDSKQWPLWKGAAPVVQTGVLGNTLNLCISQKEIITGSACGTLLLLTEYPAKFYYSSDRVGLRAIFLVNLITVSLILTKPYSVKVVSFIGTMNVQISGVSVSFTGLCHITTLIFATYRVTAILVSSLFLNLKEDAYCSRLPMFGLSDIANRAFPQHFIIKKYHQNPIIWTSGWDDPNQSTWAMTSDINHMAAELASPFEVEPEHQVEGWA